MSAVDSRDRPDRILILARADLRIAIPLLDAVDPTPLGVIISALPTILLAQRQAPRGAELGPPLEEDAAVLMLRVVGDEDPLVPDVGLFLQTEGKWNAGDGAEGGRTTLTARVPELEVELIDVERPVIALRGVDLELTVLQDLWGGDRPISPGEATDRSRDLLDQAEDDAHVDDVDYAAEEELTDPVAEALLGPDGEEPPDGSYDRGPHNQ